jgi:hypothetical protein
MMLVSRPDCCSSSKRINRPGQHCYQLGRGVAMGYLSFRVIILLVSSSTVLNKCSLSWLWVHHTVQAVVNASQIRPSRCNL